MNNEPKIVTGMFHRGILTRAMEQIKAWKSNREAIQRLRAMPDRLLDDIGINRHDIPQIVWQHSSGLMLEMPLKNKPEAFSKIRRAA